VEYFGPFLVAAGQHRDDHQHGVVVGRLFGAAGPRDVAPCGQQQTVVRVSVAVTTASTSG
jgi:hypothetical protein